MQGLETFDGINADDSSDDVGCQKDYGGHREKV